MSLRFNENRPPASLVRNLEDAGRPWASEVETAAPRAVAAGARPPLTYVGMGMTGIVFTDRTKNLAYKVARGTDWSMVAEEAEWLRAAGKTEGVREIVPRGIRWDAENGVLIRQYARGRPGGWGDATKLYDLHKKIEEKMLPRGWTAPERKEDSYVVSGGQGYSGDFTKATLVDASMPHRVGKELVRYALDVAAGRRKPRNPHESLSDIAYYVYRERMAPENYGGTIPVKDVRKVLAALREAGGEFEWSV